MVDETRVRRTDAKVKGDMFDAIMLQQKKFEEMDEPEQISDYPETTIETLRLFQKLWILPYNAIPSKHLRGRFAQWINELDQLNQICGNDINKSMTLAFEKWSKMKNRFIVSHPLAIRSLLIDAVAELNRGNKKKKDEQLASPEKVKSTIKQLKSVFEEEE